MSTTTDGTTPVEFFEQRWTVTQSVQVIDFLSANTPISKSRLKGAMNKGALWLRRGRNEKRLRRVQSMLEPGDQLSLHYDTKVLSAAPDAPVLLADLRGYTVWDKPPGMLSQGTRFGDHAALPRWIEQHVKPTRPTWLVHRLDREASGIIVIAHTAAMAGKLSTLFSGRDVAKCYRVDVLGVPPTPDEWVSIKAPLDGKAAESRYRVVAAADGQAQLEVDILTGRTHQIRRHLAGAGYPVLGDPRYGEGNRDPRGLRLRAVSLRFICPITGHERSFRVADEWQKAAS